MRTSAGRKGIPGRGKSKFKGPEVGIRLVLEKQHGREDCGGVGARGGEWQEAELSGPWEGLVLF